MNYEFINDDCIKYLRKNNKARFDMIFADPPYFLSNGGITCKSGKMASVNKGNWDSSNGFHNDLKFTKSWLKACDRVLKDNGSIWISGTYHNIHIVTYLLLSMDYHIINEITWFKPNAAPNLGCRNFTASHETLIWAKKNKKTKHTFNYSIMKEMNNNKQMRSVWEIPTTKKSEKSFGQHPTQKPIELLNRCIIASTNEGDYILDPFCGSGTTGVSAAINNRNFIGIDISNEYIELTKKRIEGVLI